MFNKQPWEEEALRHCTLNPNNPCKLHGGYNTWECTFNWTIPDVTHVHSHCTSDESSQSSTLDSEMQQFSLPAHLRSWRTVSRCTRVATISAVHLGRHTQVPADSPVDSVSDCSRSPELGLWWSILTLPVVSCHEQWQIYRSQLSDWNSTHSDIRYVHARSNELSCYVDPRGADDASASRARSSQLLLLNRVDSERVCVQRFSLHRLQPKEHAKEKINAASER